MWWRLCQWLSCLGLWWRHSLLWSLWRWWLGVLHGSLQRRRLLRSYLLRQPLRLWLLLSCRYRTSLWPWCLPLRYQYPRHQPNPPCRSPRTVNAFVSRVEEGNPHQRYSRWWGFVFLQHSAAIPTRVKIKQGSTPSVNTRKNKRKTLMIIVLHESFLNYC
jgi:hypothetical protein